MAKGTRAAKGGRIVLFVFCAIVATFVSLMLGGLEIGEKRIIDGLRADGYDVVIDKSVDPGLGRYTIRVWERGIGWVEVER